MTRVSYEEAYPGIEWLPRSRNWWARLRGVPAECRHLEQAQPWMASLVPDTLYLRGKASLRRARVRPEVSLCRMCLLDVISQDLARYRGRVVAFEPNAESFHQYFFVGTSEFDAAGLTPELGAAIAQRLGGAPGTCSVCSREEAWLWFPGEEVPQLDDADRIRAVAGKRLCAVHGAEKLCRAFQLISEANLFYMNLPYGDAGAYVWI